MTQQELQDLLNTIVTDLNTAATFAGVIDPALVPFIQIGKAVDKAIPGLAASVAGWIGGQAPTDAEKADFAAKLAALGNPDGL